MYIPQQFENTDLSSLHALMRARPLATLVVVAEDGLSADHVPLLLSAETTPLGTLRGHVARSNPLWRRASQGIDCLAVFHGGQHYISPGWYATKSTTGRVVPTWNYATVHAHGQLRAVDDGLWLRQLLDDLTTQMETEAETGMAAPWRVEDAPADFTESLQRAIVGIELRITRLEGKSKLSQNQPAENRTSLVQALQALGSDEARAMARAIGSLGR